MVGLGRVSIAKSGMDLGQNLILDCVVAFLRIGDTQPDLMLLCVIDDAIVSGVGWVVGVTDPEEDGIFQVAINQNWTPVREVLNELRVD